LPLVCLAVNVGVTGTAGAVVTRQETVTASQEGGSPLLLPVILGGTDQTYVLFIATRDNNDVTGVTGGGLTWTEQVEQCSGREQQGIRLWTAQCSFGPAFEVTITWNDDGSEPIVAVLSRYSGVGSLEDSTGENTIGAGGACDNGDDTDSPRLTLTSTTAGSVHLIGVNSRKDPIESHSPGYTEITSVVEGSSGDKTILTTYEQTFDPAATDSFQAAIGSTEDWCTAGIVLNPLGATAAPVEARVTSRGLWLRDAELLWIRSQTADDTVLLTIGELLAQKQNSYQRLYFLRSECLAWSEEIYGCLQSELQVELLLSVEYDILAWSEAPDRVAPDRDLRIVGQRWRFHPGDINLDGLVSCADIELFWEDEYDWNLDGSLTQEDRESLTAEIGRARRDLDGNGTVDEADMEILLSNWGPCPDPPESCPGDLDCDGLVGIEDLQRMLNSYNLTTSD
jgi:hypothetical protein